MAIELRSNAVRERAAGVLVGQACGDALGVPYEFGPPPLNGRPEMRGGGLGGYAPGEWSDDTQMAICIAEVAATGIDLTSDEALDEIAERFEEWFASDPADMGIQTRSVLSQAALLSGSPAQRLREAARQVHERTGLSAGNGALMRTSPVALAHHDPAKAAGAARQVAELTHFDPLAGDAAVLWTELIRRAVLDGRSFDLDLTLIPAERRTYWAGLIAEAADQPPKTFVPNGDSMRALQAAYAAITTAAHSGPTGSLVEDGLVAAVLVGNDTDTVAAIAGGALGALRGLGAFPAPWVQAINGWPGYRAHDLVRLALAIVDGGPTPGSWPWVQRMPAPLFAGHTQAVPHPHDEGVLLGTIEDLDRIDELGVDAVVSLCRIGQDQLAPSGVSADRHAQFWLIDSDDPTENPNIRDVLGWAATMTRIWRQRGHRVLIHCVASQRRTPAVALAYAALLGMDVGEAAEELLDAMPSAYGHGYLWDQARTLADLMQEPTKGDPVPSATEVNDHDIAR